jgi:hypothetical protein
MFSERNIVGLFEKLLYLFSRHVLQDLTPVSRFKVRIQCGCGQIRSEVVKFFRFVEVLSNSGTTAVAVPAMRQFDNHTLEFDDEYTWQPEQKRKVATLSSSKPFYHSDSQNKVTSYWTVSNGNGLFNNKEIKDIQHDLLNLSDQHNILTSIVKKHEHELSTLHAELTSLTNTVEDRDYPIYLIITLDFNHWIHVNAI